MPRKPNPQKLDADSPELNKDWFAKAKLASEVLPKLIGKKNAAAHLAPKAAGRLLLHRKST